MSQLSECNVPAAAALRPGERRLSLRAVFETLALWRQRSRDRAALARLDARLLRDMGISLDAAREETSKPFWKA